VCNRVGLESGHLEIGHVESTLNRRVDYQLPDDWKTVSSAINVGAPLIEAAPKSRVRQAIQEMAQSIADPQSGVSTDGSKGGLLGRIFSTAS
jgi:MinD-like ATPase involved in chromosome partitioning or flagellar assembly